jgi:hypothetical protein
LSALLFFFAPSTSFSQQRDLTLDSLVYQIPQMDSVRVRTDIVYKRVGDSSLKFDLYTPTTGVPPVVLFVNAGDNNDPTVPRVRKWGGYVDWCRLVAASGMAGVVYENREGDREDLQDVVRALIQQSGSLGIDASRLAIWCSSRNAIPGTWYMMDATRPPVRCGVIYYGEPKSDSIRRDIPLLLVRSGTDNLRANYNGMDKQLVRYITEDVPVSFINGPGLIHGFDAGLSTEESRRIIRQTVEFLTVHLNAPTPYEATPIPTLTRITALIKSQGWPAAEPLLRLARRSPEGERLFFHQRLIQVAEELYNSEHSEGGAEVMKFARLEFPNSFIVALNQGAFLKSTNEEANYATAAAAFRDALVLLAQDTIVPQARREYFQNMLTSQLDSLKNY